MNPVDIIFLIFLSISAFSAYIKGFLRTIIGPFVFCLTAAIAFSYFKQTHELFISLALVSIGSILLSLFVHLFLNLTCWRNKHSKPSITSRLFAIFFNLIWGSAVFLCLMVFIVIVPMDALSLNDINETIRASKTFKYIKQPLESYGIIPKDVIESCTSGLCSMSNQEIATLTNDPDVQAMMNDERILKISTDEDLQNAIKRNDIPAILGNPTIQELSKDTKFLSQVLRIYPKMKALKAATEAASRN